MSFYGKKLVKSFDLKKFIEEGFNDSMNYDDIGFNLTNEWGRNNNVIIISHEYKLNQNSVDLYAVYTDKLYAIVLDESFAIDYL